MDQLSQTKTKKDDPRPILHIIECISQAEVCSFCAICLSVSVCHIPHVPFVHYILQRDRKFIFGEVIHYARECHWSNSTIKRSKVQGHW